MIVALDSVSATRLSQIGRWLKKWLPEEGVGWCDGKLDSDSCLSCCMYSPSLSPNLLECVDQGRIPLTIVFAFGPLSLSFAVYSTVGADGRVRCALYSLLGSLKKKTRCVKLNTKNAPIRWRCLISTVERKPP